MEYINVVDSFLLTFGGHTFFIVYGSCFDSWFFAIPNWNTSSVIWDPSYVDYNTEAVLDALETDLDDARAIAEAIYSHAHELGLC